MSQEHNHFTLFQLPQQFALDSAALEQAYRKVQSQVHPDRFASAGDAEKRVAMQWATRANEAFQILKSPLKRAAYLCQLHGVDLAIESNTAMPPEFLMHQMEWREALHEARAGGHGEPLAALESELKAMQTDLQHTLERQIDQQGDYAAAAQSVRQWMFVDKFAAEIDAAYAAIEG
ncbi:MAG: Fe-S protein assembly co-chaperone HscB [Burkholderiaceae bacterium]|nr:MAG: Fe-S protein assembly co-chaperone HscB [Burkholderiaceae bacterium]